VDRQQERDGTMYIVYYDRGIDETYREEFHTFEMALKFAEKIRDDGAIVRIYNPHGYLMNA
jgi:hypothetical protein